MFVLRVKTNDGDAYYTTQSEQDQWSQSWQGFYTSDLQKATVFTNLHDVITFIMHELRYGMIIPILIRVTRDDPNPQLPPLRIIGEIE